MASLWTDPEAAGQAAARDTGCSRCGAGALVDGRYCATCGLDTKQNLVAPDINQQRLAADREQQWLGRHPGVATSKSCPDCAESVAAAANVCRFCGYRFDTGLPGNVRLASTPAAHALSRKSPAGAAWLGFFMSGLGHLYIGEVARGLMIFSAAVLCGIASIVGGLGLMLFSAFVWIVSIRDAYVGAQHRNEQGVTRPLSGRVWALLVGAVCALFLGLVLANNDSGSDAASVAEQIKPDLVSQLRDRDATMTVDALDCAAASDSGGSCLADVTSADGVAKISITYTVDPDTGVMLWHTDQ